jgi:hypothetical protein
MLIAVDTNVLMDLAAEVETIADVSVPALASPREILRKFYG